MTHTQNARRFYIDRIEDQPIVRRVPVRSVSPATHQVGSTPENLTAPVLHSRRHGSRVRALVRSARRHIRHDHA
jgi:hypothetical protein